MSRPYVYIGLPYVGQGPLHSAMTRCSGAAMYSANGLYSLKKGKFRAIGRTAWQGSAALDSAGFTAMRQGGYRWTVADYVALVATNGGGETSALPCPWSFWSAMDYCSEPEIAADRAEVERRIDATIASYRECLEEVIAWRDEGVTDVADPMPILQGRTVADYLRCARQLAQVIDEAHPCCCPTDPDSCEAEWHRTRLGLPELIGVGSVCRRPLHGPDGLLAILAALDRALPKGVRLHLFGVKGQLLEHLAPYRERIASIDSMAWDLRARHVAREENRSNTLEHRASVLEAWYRRQAARLAKLNAKPAQMSLFGGQ